MMSKRDTPDDRLGLARNVLLASWLVAGMVLGLMLIDGASRPSIGERSSHGWVKGLSLSNLSIVPSGRPLRNPGARHPAVDLRFSPFLPRIETAPAGLLLREAGSPDNGFSP
jgi:hypothetical protein